MNYDRARISEITAPVSALATDLLFALSGFSAFSAEIERCERGLPTILSTAFNRVNCGMSLIRKMRAEPG